MKSVKTENGELSCLIEDAIFFADNSYIQISGDFESGFRAGARRNVDEILNNGWSALYRSIDASNEKYIAFAGETSWGGTGFVAVKNLEDDAFIWVLHLSTMNNPEKIFIEDSIVRLTTDLNFPDGLDFIIPIGAPEEFVVEIPK